jgi:hypothetical protein
MACAALACGSLSRTWLKGRLGLSGQDQTQVLKRLIHAGGFREETEPGDDLGSNALFPRFGTFQGDTMDSSALLSSSVRLSASSGRACTRSEAIPASPVNFCGTVLLSIPIENSPWCRAGRHA